MNRDWASHHVGVLGNVLVGERVLEAMEYYSPLSRNCCSATLSEWSARGTGASNFSAA